MGDKSGRDDDDLFDSGSDNDTQSTHAAQPPAEEEETAAEPQASPMDEEPEGEPQSSTQNYEDLGLGSDSDESDAERPAERPSASTNGDDMAADEEDSAAPGDKPSLGELFGTDDEAEDEAAEAGEGRAVRPGSDDEFVAAGGQRRARAVGAPSSEDQLVSLPTLPRPGQGSQVYVTKLPNVLGVKPECFDEANFDVEADEASYRLATDIVRWRYQRDSSGIPVRDEAGELIRESNARLVKWSNGTLQLLVGDEAFDVAVHPVSKSYMFVRQTHLQGQSMLECQGRLDQKMTFRPSGLSSRAHRAMAVRVRSATAKGVKMQQYNELEDPEKIKQRRAKMSEDLSKHNQRRSNVYAQYGQSRPGGRSKGRAPALNKNYLEEGADQYDETSVKALKAYNRYEARDSGSDESSEGDERAERLLRAKEGRNKRAAGRSRAEISDRETSEDSEEDEEPPVRNATPRDTRERPVAGKAASLKGDSSSEAEDFVAGGADEDEEEQHNVPRRQGGADKPPSKRRRIDSDDDE